MVLAEKHNIKRKKKNRDLFAKIDGYCLSSKNLRNYVNYIIKQCCRISTKLKDGEILDSWEKSFIYYLNCGIKSYNESGSKKSLKYIDGTNSFIADAYFLSWFLKTLDVYKNMPNATSAQICIQMLCKDWKAFYQGMKTWKKNPERMLGRPKSPRYYDKETGRNWIVLTNQNIKGVDSNGYFQMPKAFVDIRLKPRHTGMKQVRILIKKDIITIDVLYEVSNTGNASGADVMGVDLGVDNLAVLTFSNQTEPVIIDGKYIKAQNQWYNKEKARLQGIAKKYNNSNQTDRMCRLTRRRNNKVKDYMHKASRKVVELACKNQIGTIVIGNNTGWKQKIKLGTSKGVQHRNNQNFVSISYLIFINMVKYKAELAGITVKVVNEAYTSGTSYLDGEQPNQYSYDKSRRIHRGMFVSNNGVCINSDVNASYQIMKKADKVPVIKTGEKVIRLRVA